MNESLVQPKDIIPIWEMPKRYPNFGSKGAWRFRMNRRHINGLAECGAMIKDGRQVFVVLPRYIDWLLEQH